MNMFKSNGGFTLVELIVVIAILGLLAGIGIPTYSKYIEKAQTVQGQVDGHAVDINNKANAALEKAGLTADLTVEGVEIPEEDDAQTP